MGARVNGVHPSEFVFQKSRAIASDFCGIQTHEGELRSARAPTIDYISSTMFFFSVITLQKLRKSPQIVGKHKNNRFAINQSVTFDKFRFIVS